MLGCVTAMRFLFTVFSDSGHLNPMVSVAQRLQRRGHEITFFSCQGDVTERCERAGLNAQCVGGTPRAGERSASTRTIPQLAENMANPAWLKRWLWTVLVDPVAGQVNALRTLIQEVRPQVIATDAMAYAGAIAATLEGVPWAALATGLQSFSFGGSLGGDDGPNAAAFAHLARPRAAHIAKLGVELAFRSSDVVSPALNMVFASPRLLPEAALPPGVRAVGAALPLGDRGDEASFPWDRLPAGRPIVYVAFGSQISPPVEVYEILAASLHPEEAFLVMAVKDLLDEPRIRALPSHVLAVRYAPQVKLLAHASAMVNHGGANSVMECLALGTPMLLLPLVNDQFVMARLVEQSGTGIALAMPLALEACREALLRLLRPDNPFRAQAAPPKPGEHGEDGAEEAADLLLRLGA